MKLSLMLGMSVVAMSLFVAAPVQAQAANEMKVTEEDTAKDFRLMMGGMGRFGMDMQLQTFRSELVGSIPLGAAFGWGGDHGDLYGVGADVQFNLLSEESFNLWLGLGGSWMPEQDFVDYRFSTPSMSGLTLAMLTDLSAYDVRLMLIPEWQITENFAVGLRAGVGVTHFEWESTAQIGFSKVGELYSFKEDHHDLTLQGILGLQMSWMLTDNVGIYAYCDGRFGEDMEFTFFGCETGKISSTSLEGGIGISMAF